VRANEASAQNIGPFTNRRQHRTDISPRSAGYLKRELAPLWFVAGSAGRHLTTTIARHQPVQGAASPVLPTTELPGCPSISRTSERGGFASAVIASSIGLSAGRLVGDTDPRRLNLGPS